MVKKKKDSKPGTDTVNCAHSIWSVKLRFLNVFIIHSEFCGFDVYNKNKQTKHKNRPDQKDQKSCLYDCLREEAVEIYDTFCIHLRCISSINIINLNDIVGLVQSLYVTWRERIW